MKSASLVLAFALVLGITSNSLAEGEWYDYWYTFATGNDANWVGQEEGTDSLWSCGPGGVTLWNLSDGTYQRFRAGPGGLVSNYVNCGLIDSEGNKWFGTDEGVSMYDGAGWTTYTTGNGLLNNYISNIYQDSQGRIWFASFSSVCYIDGCTWNTPTVLEGPTAYFHPSSLCEGNNGVLWFASYNGVAAWDGTDWATYNTDDGLADNNVGCMYYDAQGGSMWFGTENGLSSWDGSVWNAGLNSLAQNDALSAGINSISMDAQGALWLGTADGVYLWNGSEWVAFKFSSCRKLNGDYIHSIYNNPQSDITWVSTNHGINRYDSEAGGTDYVDEGWSGYYTNEPISSNCINSLYYDSESRLWIGESGGMDIVKDIKALEEWMKKNTPAVSPYCTDYLGPDSTKEEAGFIPPADNPYVTSFTGAPPDWFGDFCEDNQDNIWCGSGDGAFRYDGANCRSYTTDDGLVDNNVNRITQDSEGNMWFSTWNGASKFDGTSWQTFTTDNGLLSNNVCAMASDNQGNTWFGSYMGGAAMYNGTEWHYYTKSDGLYENTVSALGCDGEGNIWFGGHSGISMYDGSSWTTWSADQGFEGRHVTDFFFDSDNNTWCAAGNGAWMFDGETWFNYTTADGLAHKYVSAISQDSDGNMYFGTACGLSVRYAGGSTEPQQPGCDFNEDGNINIADVIALLLYQRANPGDLKADFNQDGSANIADAIAMLLAQRGGTCPDASAMLSSSSAGSRTAQPARLEGLSEADLRYLEETMAALDLTEEEKAAFRTALYGETGASSLPKAFSLAQNAPNPFNPATTIGYAMPEGSSGHVTLKVYDTRGRLVRTLVSGSRDAGTYSVFWDGADEAGRPLASGLYFCRMQAGDFSKTRKMILLK